MWYTHSEKYIAKLQNRDKLKGAFNVVSIDEVYSTFFLITAQTGHEISKVNNIKVFLPTSNPSDLTSAINSSYNDKLKSRTNNMIETWRKKFSNLNQKCKIASSDCGKLS